VEEFGVGFPPRLIAVKKGETTYSLNAVPLGGFTKMAGEEDPKVPRSLASKGIGTRIIVLSAGAIMNALLPLLLFSIAFMVPHDVVTEPTVVQTVDPGSPAAMAGIKPGDALLAINGKTINNFNEFQRYVFLNLGETVTLLVRHSDNSTAEVRLVPRWKPPPAEGAIGIERDLEFALANRVVLRRAEPPWRAIPMGATESVEAFVLFKNEVLSWIVGAAPVQVSGPVGLAQVTGQVAKAGISLLLEFTGFISISLAVTNILPLPALDGGRIAFVLLEFVRRGKRVSPKTEGMVHLIGFAMLIALMIFITYQDILRIISGGSLIQ